jgi:protein N-lysine methyltransferase METTL21D
MFYYLSFLRPPPTHAATSNDFIIITPQISNDLRTELCSGTHDIFYTWLLSSPPNSMTKMSKLTSWKQHVSAYKEIAVPLPPGARIGQSWRLVLTAKPTSLRGISIDEYSTIGQDPFPIISMPIEIVQRSSKAMGKQELVERIYRMSQDPDKFLTIREKTSFDLDKVCFYPCLQSLQLHEPTS